MQAIGVSGAFTCGHEGECDLIIHFEDGTEKHLPQQELTLSHVKQLARSPQLWQQILGLNQDPPR